MNNNYKYISISPFKYMNEDSTLSIGFGGMILTNNYDLTFGLMSVAGNVDLGNHTLNNSISLGFEVNLRDTLRLGAAAGGIVLIAATIAEDFVNPFGWTNDFQTISIGIGMISYACGTGPVPNLSTSYGY